MGGSSSSSAAAAKSSNLSSVDNYVGISVKVAFGANSPPQIITQLSGGQKTVVALALIFAIQKTDRGYFYLFDEIDANLDPAYRTAIASA